MARIASPVITEVSRVVIGALWTKRKVQEARAEGVAEGEERANRRRRDAEATGEAFTAPEPESAA